MKEVLEIGEFYIEREDMHQMSKDMYSSIKDNTYIPKDVIESWRDLCISESDINNLCNY